MARLALASAVLLAACRTAAPAPDVPARLVAPTADERAAVARAIGEALGVDPVLLAPDALTADDMLLLERGRARGVDGLPLDGRSRDPGERLRLVRSGERCLLLRDGGQRIPLPGVRCAPR